MAVKINIATKTLGGITIPTGAIVCFTTTFPARVLQMQMNFAVYKDLTTVRDAGRPIADMEGIPLYFEKTYDIVDFALLDQAAIEAEALAFIETSVGAGNCETITKDQLQPI